DLDIFQGEAKRVGRVKDEENKYKNQEKEIVAMKYLGKSLYSFLKRNRLSNSQRYDLALKISKSP
ncbi:hypothetical protein, partial [Piscirickettsia litoralis]|uniref:hypothetical protein n=1 Tax=Piscirickettsia litoralis TaxID=1891921 RepID=UPI001300DEC7